MTTTHQHRPARRAAFTLVELLVVIGIIVVLIGILVPVVSRVRTASRVASVQAQLSSLSGAIERYHQEFKAYPGPLDNNQVYTDGSSHPAPDTILLGTSAMPDNDKITMAENLVLGLLGGLRPGETLGTFVFDPTLVGKGPNSLNRASPKKYAAFLEPTDLSWSDNQPSDTAQGPGDTSGYYADNAWTERATTAGAMDSPVPEFVDRFNDPMPILYLRARPGVNLPTTPLTPEHNRIITNGTLTRPGPYDISQIAGYTFSEGDGIGSPADAPSGKSIGGGKNAKVSDYTDNNGVMFHGLRKVTPAASMGKGATGYDFPFDAYPYFTNRSASGAGGPQPKQKDGYILISAGADRVYGTADDIASFGNVTD